MMIRTLIVCTILLLSGTNPLPVFAEEPVAFALFDKAGKPVKFSKMSASLMASDVVFFGELHNNTIAHWLQLRLTQAAFAVKGKQLLLAAEMFEADNQSGMDEYLAGKIDEKKFAEKVRLWPNYSTDYKPLVDFAKDNGLRFICANIPRKYASLVYKKGVDSLMVISPEEKAWIAPLPFPYDANVGSYKRMIELSGGHGGENMPKSQAIKDATMAHFISTNFKPGNFCIHFNGSWHSDDWEGILWYMKHYAPKLKLATITTVQQKNPLKLEKENKGRADYVLVVAEDMTNTH